MIFSDSNNTIKTQTWLLIVVWILIFSMPLLSGDFENGINWKHISRIWKETLIVFVVFLINHFLLLPQIFFKEKRTAYLITVFIVILSMSFSVLLLYNYPSNSNDEFPPLISKCSNCSSRANKMLEKPPFPIDKPKKRPPVPPVFIMSVLIVGFDTGLALFGKWTKAEQHKLQIEKDNIKTQMTFLKNQVSPHFFMNTLNNIHALVDIDAEEAKESIIRLSELMDYMLYESETPYVSLKKEFEFIKSYIELMRLRCTDNVEITLDIPKIIPPVNVPPLLTISLIENAFKYGVDTERNSYIHVHFAIKDNKLFFEIKNSVHITTKEERKRQGIGIENVRKRLKLIYDNNYHLLIKDKNNTFEVFLKIPL